jgi:GTP cyclohydrolase I
MTGQIADAIMENLECEGAMVVLEAEHMCMTMRGVKKPGSRTVTISAKGVFKEDRELCDRFLRLMKTES